MEIQEFGKENTCEKVVVFLCSVSEIIVLIILCVKNFSWIAMHATFAVSRRYRGFSPILAGVPKNSQHIKRLIRNISRLCRSFICSIFQS